MVELTLLRRTDGLAAAGVEQELVRVSGLKFTRETRRTIYRSREFRGVWRIWEIDTATAGSL